MNVLVVDDSKTVRQYHCEILRSEGFKVDEAENGMEAYEKCVDVRYDLLIVDINMPIMDGYTFVESLRKMDAFKKVPVVMISTEAEESDKQKAFAAGSNVYYIKPVKPDELKICAEILTK